MSAGRDPFNVLILGHSFSRRLRDWCVRNGKTNLNLDPQRVCVFWYGVGGATITAPTSPKSLWGVVDMIKDLNIDVVFLDIGSNDLCCSILTPTLLASTIVQFSEHCIALGARQVVLSEILPRQHQPLFNQRVEQTNSLLSAHCVKPTTNNLYFWRHRRNRFSQRFLLDYISPDGIHVDYRKGMARYYSSVRGAVMYGEHRV